MRPILVVSAVAALAALDGASARACDGVAGACLPPVAAYPAFTPEGLRVGTVEAAVRLPPTLETSAFTGQPITVVYNDPGRLPGCVEPGLTLVRLAPAGHARTRTVLRRRY